MTQEQAIANLKKAKDLLDSGVITQADYDKIKQDLLPTLRSDFIKPEQKAESSAVSEAPTEAPVEEKADTEEPTEVKKVSSGSNTAPILVALIACLIVVIGCLCAWGFSHKTSDKKETAQYANFLDDSQEHRKQAFDLFVSNLGTTQSYVVKNGTVENRSVTLDLAESRYLVTVCYHVTRMNEPKQEYYQGYVRVSDDRKSIIHSDPIRMNAMTYSSEGVIGRWKVSTSFSKEIYEMIIRKEGVNYYLYEFGQKKKLSKKGNRYYLVGSEVGEYYLIKDNGTLHMCDKDGDFTSESGYTISCF